MARRILGASGIAAPKETTDLRLAKFGVRNRGTTQFVPRFIGEAAKTSFGDIFAEELQQVVSGSPSPPVIGGLFARGVYESSPGSSRAYEPVFGEEAFTPEADVSDVRAYYLEASTRSDAKTLTGENVAPSATERSREQASAQSVVPASGREVLTSTRTVEDDGASIEVFV